MSNTELVFSNIAQLAKALEDEQRLKNDFQSIDALAKSEWAKTPYKNIPLNIREQARSSK